MSIVFVCRVMGPPQGMESKYLDEAEKCYREAVRLSERSVRYDDVEDVSLVEGH